MSTNCSNDRASLCAFKFADGRKCRMPRRDGHPYLCAFHARKEAQDLGAEAAGKETPLLRCASPEAMSP